MGYNFCDLFFMVRICYGNGIGIGFGNWFLVVVFWCIVFVGRVLGLVVFIFVVGLFGCKFVCGYSCVILEDSVFENWLFCIIFN